MPRRARYPRDYPPYPPTPLWGGWYADPTFTPGFGLGGWGWAPAPFVPIGPGAAPGFYGYDMDYPRRRPPERSPAYGRGGDQAVRRWAERYGYDFGYEITPRSTRRRGRYG